MPVSRRTSALKGGEYVRKMVHEWLHEPLVDYATGPKPKTTRRLSKGLEVTSIEVEEQPRGFYIVWEK